MRRLLAIPSLLLCLTSGTTMAAQQEKATDQGNLEEVVVTATRRATSLQDVPLSITAYTQDQLTAKGIVGYEGLALETPGAIVNKPTANFNNFSVRGIATNGYGANLQGTVAIYIDELPISANGNSTILDPTLFDVERVEFLRGPQGTLFGSGSLAGAVRILTKSPELNQFEFKALADVGDTDSALRQRYNAMVNVPLIEDELALRVVGFHRDEDGYLFNVGTGEKDSNTVDSSGGRAILLWEPNEKFSARFMVMSEDSDPEDSSLTSPRLGKRQRISDRPDRFQSDLSSYNLTLKYAFENFELTSSTTHSDLDQLFVVDLAGTFNQFIAFALDAYGYDDIWVEEIRLVSTTSGPLDWVLGGYYYEKRRDVDFNYRSNPEFLAAAQITGLPDEYYQRFRSYTDSHEKAVFGELTWNISDRFWLTGGIRYGDTDVQSFTEPGGYNSNYLAVALSFAPGAVTITDVPASVGEKGEETGTSYKISASWKPMDNLTTYATASTGFRIPVVNAFAGRVSLLDPNDINIPAGADTDRLTNLELGLKGTWLDNRLTTNLAAYHITWEDIQVQANRVSDSIQFATNIGEATSHGLEFEIGYAPTANLFFGLNGSFNDSEVTELTATEAAISGAEEGLQLAFPEFQGAAYFTYRFGLFGAQAYVTGSVQHVDGFPNMLPNVPGNPAVVSSTYGETDSYRNINLSVGAYIGDHLNVTFYGENLNDDDSITYIHPEAFVDSRFGTLRPRTLGLRMEYDF